MAQKQAPLILIPGTDANGNRFDSFMNELMKQVGKKDILKINVKTDGTTEWTDIAMKKAHQLYSFDFYNALGHSNGGLVWTIYLEKMTQKSTSQMKNLITLGIPYNYLDSNANPYPNSSSLTETDMLRRMINKKGKIPHSLRMISIAGNYKNNGDGVVPLTSALSSSKIYNNISSYHEKIFDGINTQHNQLTENEEIIEYVVHQLY